MQLLLAPFANFPQSFVAFAIAIALASLMVYIFLRAASTAEGRPSVAPLRRCDRPNAKILFGLLFIGWAIAFGATMLVVPHEGASSPYGGARPDRHVHRLLRHDGLPLGGHRRLTAPG